SGIVLVFHRGSGIVFPALRRLTLRFLATKPSGSQRRTCQAALRPAVATRFPHPGRELFPCPDENVAETGVNPQRKRFPTPCGNPPNARNDSRPLVRTRT